MNDITIRFGARSVTIPATGQTLAQVIEDARPGLRLGETDSVRVQYQGTMVSDLDSVVPEGGTTINILNNANRKA